MLNCRHFALQSAVMDEAEIIDERRRNGDEMRVADCGLRKRHASMQIESPHKA